MKEPYRIAVAAALLAAAPASAALPGFMAQHGRVMDLDDKPLNGNVTLAFKISKLEHRPSSTTTETFAWAQAEQTVTAWQGYYTVILGSDANPLGAGVFLTDEERWLVIYVNGQEMEPRLRIASTAYAQVAGHAAEAAEAVHAAEAAHAADAAHADDADEALHAGSATSAGRATVADGVDCDHCLTAAEIDEASLDAIDAATVGGLGASAAPAAGKLLALGNDAKFAASAIPAVDAASVNGIMAAATPAANKLLALDGAMKLPLSVLPSGIDAATILGHALITPSGSGKIPVLDDTEHIPASMLPTQIDVLAGIQRPCAGALGVQTWNGTAWSDCATPPADCKAIRDAGAGLARSGIYVIDPDGAGTGVAPFRAYCDMDTAGGGWTLCLNSRYTGAAAALFSTTYAKIYPPNDNPGGYYDFCPQTKTDYIFSLADEAFGRYFLHTATLKFANATPYNQSGEWTTVEIKSASTDVTWINRHPTLPATLVDATIYLQFWEYVNPTSRGLKGFKRGHLNLPIAGGNPGQNLVMGSGCNYSSCSSPPSYETDLYPTYSAWTWIVTSTVGVGNNSWTVQPIRAQRTLIFYR